MKKEKFIKDDGLLTKKGTVLFVIIAFVGALIVDLLGKNPYTEK